MNLAHRGPFDGSPVNMSGKYFNFVAYRVNEDGYLITMPFARRGVKSKNQS